MLLLDACVVGVLNIFAIRVIEWLGFRYFFLKRQKNNSKNQPNILLIYIKYIYLR